MRKWTSLGVLAGALLSQAAHSAPPATASPARAACSASAYRQLDFWIGEWEVFNTADGVHTGSSRIEAIMNGCAIKESYDAPAAPGGPYRGTSYSAYDRKDAKWHQLYVDTNGNANWFTGEAEGMDVALTATVRGGAIQRMVYRRQPDGSVRQIATISTDGGKTWSSGYDLSYRRKAGR